MNSQLLEVKPIVSVEPSIAVELKYPVQLAGKLLDAAVSLVPDIVTVLAIKGIKAVVVIARVSKEASLELEFYSREHTYLKKYVIPNNAMYSAIQRGRNQINSLTLDPDLRRRALADLDKSLTQWESSRG